MDRTVYHYIIIVNIAKYQICSCLYKFKTVRLCAKRCKGEIFFCYEKFYCLFLRSDVSVYAISIFRVLLRLFAVVAAVFCLICGVMDGGDCDMLRYGFYV